MDGSDGLKRCLQEYERIIYITDDNEAGSLRIRLEQHLKGLIAHQTFTHDLPDFVSQVLISTFCENDDVDAGRSSRVFRALEQYALNLVLRPWKKEYKKIKKYSGFYFSEVAPGVIDTEILFEHLGYQPMIDTGDGATVSADGQTKTSVSTAMALATNFVNHRGEVYVLTRKKDPRHLVETAFYCCVAALECDVAAMVRERLGGRGTFRQIFAGRMEGTPGRGVSVDEVVRQIEVTLLEEDRQAALRLSQEHELSRSTGQSERDKYFQGVHDAHSAPDVRSVPGGYDELGEDATYLGVMGDYEDDDDDMTGLDLYSDDTAPHPGAPLELRSGVRTLPEGNYQMHDQLHVNNEWLHGGIAREGYSNGRGQYHGNYPNYQHGNSTPGYSDIPTSLAASQAASKRAHPYAATDISGSTGAHPSKSLLSGKLDGGSAVANSPSRAMHSSQVRGREEREGRVPPHPVFVGHASDPIPSRDPRTRQQFNGPASSPQSSGKKELSRKCASCRAVLNMDKLKCEHCDSTNPFTKACRMCTVRNTMNSSICAVCSSVF